VKKLLWIIVLIAVVLAVVYALAINTRIGQDLLLDRLIAAAMRAAPEPPPEGGLRVFMCGTSSPLPAPGRAQACVAVMADDRLYLVDAGAGSPAVATLGGLPLENLRAILLTHFHSDHIAAVPDFALNSWVAGRPQPLEVVGPEGVERVVAGFNDAYALDGGYRVTHHGADLLPPALHDLVPRTIEPGVIVDEGGLVIRAFEVDHRPVEPAVGYRFDYGGRSVLITGDTVMTPGVINAAKGVDLMLADALSLPIVQAMERAAGDAGAARRAKIFHDIQDYHASVWSLGDAAAEAGVGRLALYHLVPPPRNALMENVFLREVPEGTVLTEDGMIFDLPAGSDAVIIR
jgi:ribonuclease Z